MLTGCTLTALVPDGAEAWIVQIGDSRAYRLRGDLLELLTVDHTAAWLGAVNGWYPFDSAEAHVLALRRALELAPEDWVLSRNTGAMLVARQSPAEALPLLERAAAWIDDDVDCFVALGWAHRALGQRADADAAFAKARTLEPRYPGLPAEEKIY